MISYSTDGIYFSPPQVFQDSSGVPSIAATGTGGLITAFQWFPAPMHGHHWDSVAVKFSQDDGLTWSSPAPIIVTGMPTGFQRPFDPAITVLENGMYRLYFSSGIPPSSGADSTIDTYSAISSDGIHYQFEPGARVNNPVKKMIDPTVIKFKGLWHYIAPIGAPQEGAYHYISNDGLNFQITPNIPSDPVHNWTGNLMIENSNEMRFYGCGPWIWFSATPDGGQWLTPVNTNIQGGDPAVIKNSSGNYLMIYVGFTLLSLNDKNHPLCRSILYPNPVTNELFIECRDIMKIDIYDISWKLLLSFTPDSEHIRIPFSGFAKGLYFVHLIYHNYSEIRKIIR